MYEGVHNQHHAKTYYGTANDPEYLPLALMKPWTLPVFLIAAALAPIGMLIRFGILAPLVAAVAEAARGGGRAAIRACRSTRASAGQPPQGDFARALALAGSGGEHLGDRADRSWSRPASSRCSAS